MKGFLLKAAIVVVLTGFGWHEVDVHHIGAPADPYGPCPAGSHYVSFWTPDSQWSKVSGVPGSQPPASGPGVLHYMGYTEVATCGASLTITGG